MQNTRGSIPLHVHHLKKRHKVKVIAKCKVGSHLYGLNGPDSDEDWATVVASEDLNYIIGLDKLKNTQKITDDEDDCIYWEWGA